MPPDPASSDEDEPIFVAEALSASPESMDALVEYRALLEAWSGRFNLIGPSVLGDFWRRHVLDSGQLAALAPAAATWIDLGSGAGFPGLVVAILIRNRPGARVHLVESMAKRCRFLEAAADALALPVQVHNTRAESLRLEGDVVTARACARLDRLLGFAAPYLLAGAQGLFLKGREAETELTEARARWRLDAELLPSLSDSAGRIIRVRRLSRA